MKPRHIVFFVLLINVLGIVAIVWKWKAFSPSRDSTFSGFVLAPDGSPANGATVYLLVSPSNPRDMVPPPPRGTTVPNGEFRIGSVQPYAYFAVATHPTWCDSVPMNIQLGPGRRGPLVLQLTRGGRVTGSVRPSEGPVAGRQIHLFGYQDQATSSDGSGAYVFEGVQAGDWHIYLDPVGGTNSRHYVQSLTVRDGQTTVYDVKAQR